MTIRLQPKPVQAPKPKTNFTKEQIEDLFSQNKNWNNFYEKNKDKLKPEKLDVYQWCVYPLHKKEGRFYTCILHPMVDVDAGNKHITYKYENINFSEFISHCIYYKPEEHKQYIMDKLIGS